MQGWLYEISNGFVCSRLLLLNELIFPSVCLIVQLQCTWFSFLPMKKSLYVFVISGMLLNGQNHSQSWVIARISVVPQTVEFVVARHLMHHRDQDHPKHLQQEQECLINCDEVCRAAPAFSAQRILPPLVKITCHHRSRYSSVPPYAVYCVVLLLALHMSAEYPLVVNCTNCEVEDTDSLEIDEYVWRRKQFTPKFLSFIIMLDMI